jgi:hypothetical protein
MSIKLALAGIVALLTACALPAAEINPRIEIASLNAEAELRLTPQARLQFDSLSRESIELGTERMRCVVEWRRNGNAILIAALAPTPEFTFGDSITVYVNAPEPGKQLQVCGNSRPIVHTHLPSEDGTWYPRPSQFDVEIARERQRVAFGIVVAVTPDKQGYGLVLYGLKRGEQK